MSTERRITRQAAESAMRQIARAIAAGEQQASIDLAGSEILLEKTAAPDDGYTIRGSGQSTRARVFPAPERVPPGYPAGVPFVPGESVTISEPDAPTLTVVWWVVTDRESFLSDVDRQCIDTGWLPVEPLQQTNFGMLRRAYAKEGAERIITAADIMVTLIQR